MNYKLLKNNMFMIVLSQNDLFGSKPEENENEFGDFVGYQGGNGGSGSGASQAQAQPKVQDLFDINDSMFVFIHE